MTTKYLIATKNKKIKAVQDITDMSEDEVKELRRVQEFLNREWYYSDTVPNLNQPVSLWL